MGGGGGQVVSVLAYYSDNPSSDPADVYSFLLKFVFEKNKNKQKEAGVGPFVKKWVAGNHSSLYSSVPYIQWTPGLNLERAQHLRRKDLFVSSAKEKEIYAIGLFTFNVYYIFGKNEKKHSQSIGYLVKSLHLLTSFWIKELRCL